MVQLIAASTKAGSVIGCLLGGALMASRGRRFAVACAVAPFLVGPMLVGFTTTLVQTVIGRLAMGVGIGSANVSNTSCR